MLTVHMFEAPSFTFWNVVYTAIGAMAFWSSWGRTKLKTIIPGDLTRYLPWKRGRPLIEFVLFIAMGCVVGVGVTNPTNPRQAISAGLGWTGALARRKE